MHRIFIAAGALCFLNACAVSDPGTGTQTLYVTAVAQSDGSSNGTSLSVVVQNGSSSGATVTDATVTLIGDKGSTYTLPFVGIFGFGANFKNNIAWEGGWRLRIQSGNDNLEAYIAGPGLTTITAPTEGSTFVKASAPNMLVQWRDEMGRHAMTTSMKFRRGSVDTTVDDNGAHSVDSASLVAASDERITITRTVSLDLRGGVTGSTFKATTSAERNIIVQ